MTIDVKRVQGAYKVQSGNGTDLLVVDPNSGYVVPSTPTASKVVITGDLYVVGTRTEISSTNITIKDPTIILNQGEPTNETNGAVTAGLSGIMISRGRNGQDNPTYGAFIEWNDTAVWNGTGPLGTVTGQFEFRVGPTNSSPLYSAIKINAIRMPIEGGTEGSYSTVNGSAPRLNIFGSDNPNSLISVKGSNYTTNLALYGDKDDIPNKEYVDNALASNINDAQNVVYGKSYVAIIDNSLDGVPSEIIGVINGIPSTKFSITSGTVVMRVSATGARFTGIELVGNSVRAVGGNDLTLDATGAGQIKLTAPTIFESTTEPVPGSGQTGLYASTPAGGGTGMYYVTSSTLGVVTQDEFVSRKKALIFSLIF